MSTRAVFLMGAPTSDTVDWDKDELLETPVFPFHASDGHHQVDWPSPDDHAVKWRLLHNQDLGQPGKGTPTDHNRDTLFATGPVEVQELSQFYDRSFSIHETSEISAPGSLSGESIQESGLQTDSNGLSIESSSDRNVGRLVPPIQCGLSDLKDIPSAGYLRSIAPQTMTVNLIVGIITIYPPRRVMTRQWKREHDIVEMVVADETKSGFNVTFWLPPTSDATGISRDDDDDLGRCLAGLRPRDIVLLRMVGLSSFRDRVYGQSLRREMTTVDLLHRRPVDATDAGGIYSLRRINAAPGDDLSLHKVGRVREWTKRFVEDERDMRHPLPPDTQ